MLVVMWCLAILAVGAVSGQTSQSVSGRDRAELERLETVWNEAHERGDAKTLDTLWADELVVTVPGMPVIGKPDSIAVWRSGRMKFARYQTSDVRIMVFVDAAVVTGRLQRERIVSGRQAEDDWRYTKTYVRRDGVWRVVAWHASESPR